MPSSFLSTVGYRDAETCFTNDGFGNRDSLIVVDPGFSSMASDVAAKIPQECSFPLTQDEQLELRIFIDRSVVEVFVNGTSTCLTRVYPVNPNSLGVSLVSRGNDACCTSLTTWNMKRVLT